MAKTMDSQAELEPEALITSHPGFALPTFSPAPFTKDAWRPLMLV